MAGEGKDVTLPTLDVDDFMGKSFTTGPDGKLYQLPDQQFANLYWFRYDWFQRPELKKSSRKYGYELGVPVNWSAYEDIAEFFTNARQGNRRQGRVTATMDYGKKAPDLGWRFTDAWLSMAGAGDKGIPNGCPWTNGASVSTAAAGRRQRVPRRRHQRPGRQVRPAQVHGLAAPLRTSRRPGHGLLQSLPSLAKGNVAQQIFWYTAFTASMVEKGTPWSTRTARPSGAWLRRPTALLGRRAEARLSGLRFLDSHEEHPG
jgi:glycerol transport system substrate-binding protein